MFGNNNPFSQQPQQAFPQQQQQPQQQPQQAPQGFPQQQQPQQAPQGFPQQQQQMQPQGFPQQQQGGFQQQVNPLGNIFSGIGNAVPRVKANYAKIGRYFVRINACKLGTKSRGARAPFAVVEYTVARVLDSVNGQGHSVAEDASWYIDMDGARADYFLPEIRGFIAAITGYDFNAIGTREAEYVFGPSQPFTGFVAEIESRLVSTKRGGVFTASTWKRQVPPHEALQQIEPSAVAVLWPNGELQRAAGAAPQTAAMGSPPQNPPPIATAAPAAPQPYGQQPQQPYGQPQQQPPQQGFGQGFAQPNSGGFGSSGFGTR